MDVPAQLFGATVFCVLRKSILCLVVAGMVLGCGKKGPNNSGAATLTDLNRALTAMTMGTGHRPSDVNELTNFPGLQGKRLPQPPAGKKLAIDQSQHRVVFVDVSP